MQKSSTYKLLLLLNILSKESYNKEQLLEALKSYGVQISKSTITNYINKLIDCGIKINIKTNNLKEKIYELEKNTNSHLSFNKKELNTISDIKKLLISQKNPTRIRRTMRLFYKLSKFIKNEDEKISFIDFGYYSTINWYLFKELEKHCEEKNIITIDYILPQGTGKEITLHTDSIKNAQWSERLYLYGVFKGSKQFSKLPIDRIYSIKKVERKNVPIELPKDTLTYIVDYKEYKRAPFESKEKITKIENNLATIQRPIDDDFHILQRLLYFCPDIYYISEGHIKELYKEKLEELKSIYGKQNK